MAKLEIKEKGNGCKLILLNGQEVPDVRAVSVEMAVGHIPIVKFEILATDIDIGIEAEALGLIKFINQG